MYLFVSLFGLFFPFISFFSLYPLAQSAKGEESVSDLYSGKYLINYKIHFMKLEEYARKLYSLQRPWRLVNYQGKFGGMHKFRWEIIVEGSDDRKEWKEYRFKYKCNADIPPGSARPTFCFLHLPRLDWRIWFLPLAATRDPPAWFHEILKGIIEGRIPILHLFQENPFPDHTPTFVRSRVLNFQFAPWKSPLWWDVTEVSRSLARPLFTEIQNPNRVNAYGFPHSEEDDEEEEFEEEDELDED